MTITPCATATKDENLRVTMNDTLLSGRQQKYYTQILTMMSAAKLAAFNEYGNW